MFGCAGGASLAAERGGAERRQESEVQPNREGVASGAQHKNLFLPQSNLVKLSQKNFHYELSN